MPQAPRYHIAILAGLAIAGCSHEPSETFLPNGQIVAEYNQTCFVDVEGVARCWGWGGLGQLGNGDTLIMRSPVLVATEQRFIMLEAGSNHTCGLNRDGAAFCWGAEVYGELGTGTTVGFALQPRAVVGGLKFLQISVGDGHTCGITTASEAFCWGLGLAGQLGTGSTSDESTPTPVMSSTRFGYISAGLMVTCGVAGGGQAYCWGDNSWGQLGIGVVGGSSDLPVAVSGGHIFQSVTVGWFSACGITTSLDAYCWGVGSFGRLGNGQQEEDPVPTPTLVHGGHKFNRLDMGSQHTCAVTVDNQAYCWGLNTYGKLGDAVGPSALEPNAVSGGLSFIQTSAGSNHSCGLTPFNEVYCWGYNILGQLGVPTQSKPTDRPIRVIF